MADPEVDISHLSAMAVLLTGSAFMHESGFEAVRYRRVAFSTEGKSIMGLKPAVNAIEANEQGGS
jgi:hypothetical protein